jgi:hypothetical protein
VALAVAAQALVLAQVRAVAVTCQHLHQAKVITEVLVLPVVLVMALLAVEVELVQMVATRQLAAPEVAVAEDAQQPFLAVQ